MLDAQAYGAVSPTAPLTTMTVKRRDLKPHDVLVEIRYTGICHSDIHYTRSEWGPASYPAVPGHEITGVVAEIGSAVTRHAVGDRVAVGCLVDSCRECAYCRAGEENHCVKDGGTLTFGSVDADGEVTQGGYSTHIVVTEDFVLRLPDGLDLAASAPLLCSGVTAYSVLRRQDVGQNSRIGVVGLGGLGHVTVKLAHAMGAEVTVLSHSPAKREDALALGADHYHATSDPAVFEQLAGSFPLLIITASAPLDLDAYLGLVATHGTLVNLGAPAQPLQMYAFSLLKRDVSIGASLIGGLRQTQEMLDFCAERGIASEVEIVAAERINEAYERMLASDVRYRFVIDATTMVRP
ncbi:NAD(P)-dependent alcohol dehydrogenase [Streptomyces sp. NPDC048277]|uniref:NAD(P)-dependent alcohol dehydrogenase n=1 Tax=Streptomyces sp. NPDC048277 TaxID=3155027 RepID=UPI0033E040D1